MWFKDKKTISYKDNIFGVVNWCGIVNGKQALLTGYYGGATLYLLQKGKGWIISKKYDHVNSGRKVLGIK